MLKVFTGVFVVEDLANTCDEVKAALRREGVEIAAVPTATSRRRHVVELHVKVEAPLGWNNELSGR